MKNFNMPATKASQRWESTRSKNRKREWEQSDDFDNGTQKDRKEEVESKRKRMKIEHWND